MTEIIVLFQLGKTCFDKARQIQQFFADDMLVIILQELGDIEYNAAIWSLKSCTQSKEPRSQIYETIGHLRTASLAFCNSARRRRIWGLLSAKPETRVRGYDSAIKSLLFIALCYRFLEESENAKDTLNRIEPLLPELQQALVDLAAESQRYRSGGVGALAAIGGTPIADELADMEKEHEGAVQQIDAKIDALRGALRHMLSTLDHD